MSFRQPAHLDRVLCPTLAGEHYFAIIGAAGYAHGILARTLRGFLRTAARLALEEGFDKVVNMGPSRIRIVSPDAGVMKRLVHDHAEAEFDRVRDRVGWSLRDLFKAGDAAPEGFTPIHKPRHGTDWRRTRAGQPIVQVSGEKRDRHFAWTGADPFMARFGPHFPETHPLPLEGEPSAAPPRTPGKRLWFAIRGYDGGCGSQPRVDNLDERGEGFHGSLTLLQTTPAFFFEVEEELPGALEPAWKALAEERAREKVDREASLVRYRKQRDEEDAAHLEATRAIFRGPA